MRSATQATGAGSPARPEFTRRQFLQWGAAGTLVAFYPSLWACGGSVELPVPERRGFFSAEEYATVEAATGRLIPEDRDPGAITARVVDYIDGLLSAFADYDAGLAPAPRIFAGGPFAGRVGGESRLDCRRCHGQRRSGAGHEGQNDFRRFVPLSRVRELAWRIRIEGSRGLPEREFNGPVKGWQQVYREGVAQLHEESRARFGREFAALSPDEQDAVLRAVGGSAEGRQFFELLYRHAVEGMYAAPEYGGNFDLVGWRYIGFEGDRQPVGYSRFDVETGQYEEFPEMPVSGPNPDET